MEWKLFEGDTPPYFTTTEFFNNLPHIPVRHQRGHKERTDMAERLIREFTVCWLYGGRAIDLGCDDGELLWRLRDIPVQWEGYTAGIAGAKIARSRGLLVWDRDFVNDPIEYGDLTILTEVVEHLFDPHSFLKSVGSPWLVVTSPSAETGDWHYEHHVWAWDIDGYRKLVEDAGWQVVRQEECVAPPTNHNGEWRPQRYQAIVARRPR